MRAFDASLKTLRAEARWRKKEGMVKPDIQAAIRLLEAAGSIGEDKEACLKFMDRVNEDEEACGQSGRRIYPLMQIRALLEALPEGWSPTPARSHEDDPAFGGKHPDEED